MTKSALGCALETGASACVFLSILALTVLGTARPAVADEPQVSVEQPAAPYRWPLAYLQRPILLLGGMTGLGVTGATFAPNHRFNVDPTNGGTYQFFPAFTAGLSGGWGIADRLEIDVFAPRLICADDGHEPSNCSSVNRFNLTNVGVSYAFLRRPRAQGAVTTVLKVYRSSPLELEWGGQVAFKLVPWRVLGIWLEADLWHDINPPATQTSQFTHGAINVGVDWQVTEQLLLGAHALPWAPVEDLNDEIALEIYGVASYTFDHDTQLALEGGSNNVRANPAWNGSVPGWYTRLTFVYWVY